MSRYAVVHEFPNGPGDARPTGMDIIEDDNLRGALEDKVIFLTGASGDIGLETARAFAATGARCFLGVRSLEKGKAACSDLLEPGWIELIQIDTSSFASVRRAVEELLSKTSQLNVLVNNAGIMACPETKSADGFELQFATNYLGPFLLFNLLKETLLASATAEYPGRVVNVSSVGHHVSGVDFENINLEGKYAPFTAYGQSKTAMIYMTNHIERLYGSQHIHGISLMPGSIMTGLMKHISDEMRASLKKNDALQKSLKNAAQGASTIVMAAIGKDWHGKGGIYLDDCVEAPFVEGPGPAGLQGRAKHSEDPEKERRLWEESIKWVGL